MCGNKQTLPALHRHEATKSIRPGSIIYFEELPSSDLSTSQLRVVGSVWIGFAEPAMGVTVVSMAWTSGYRKMMRNV